MEEKNYRLAKVIIAAIALLIMFAYVQTKRYDVYSGHVIVDKFTGTYKYAKQ